jgi:hypothetical protein
VTAELTAAAAVCVLQGADPNLHNNDGWTALDLACELSKLGKVLVKPATVPVHALLVGYGEYSSYHYCGDMSCCELQELLAMCSVAKL